MLTRRTEQEIEQIANEVEETVAQDFEEERDIPIRFNKVVSTGSTLLDLAISGSKVRGGGLPGGILVEIYGPASSGKSAVISEVAGSIQRHDGEILFKDPEGRLDQEYAEIYGVHIDEKCYSQPDTVTQAFKDLYTWKPVNPDAINGICIDSLAALSTDMELGEGDAYGMRRAKEFSQELRKSCRFINRNNWLVLCSNQIRDGEGGKMVTPGGKGVPFYASLRIQIKPCFVGGSKIEGKIKYKLNDDEPKEETGKRAKKKENEKEIIEIIGVRSECTITKSTIDNPWRTCNISIIFGMGIDDVRDNLIYVKEMTGATKFSIDGNTNEDAPYKSYVALEKMLKYVEEEGLEEVLRNKVIDIWEAIDREFKKNQRTKKRW